MSPKVLVILSFSILASTSYAGMVEGVGTAKRLQLFDSPQIVSEQPAKQAQAPSLWDRFKAKVNQWLQPDPSRAPASVADQESATPPLPVVKIEGTTAEELKQISESLKNQDVITTVEPERKVSDLPTTKSGVPTFSLTEEKVRTTKSGKKVVKRVPITVIPALDIGEEAKISSKSLTMGHISFPKIAKEKVEQLQTPRLYSAEELKKWLGEPAKVVKKLEKKDLELHAILKAVTLKKVAEVEYKIGDEVKFSEMAVKSMSEEDLKFLRGLMLYVQGDKCHFASGIFHDLQSSSVPDIKNRSKYYMAMCLHKMGLYTGAIDHMNYVLKHGNVDQKNDVAEAISKNLPEDYQELVTESLERTLDSLTVKDEVKHTLAYIVSKVAIQKGHNNTAIRFAQMVPSGHSMYIRAQYAIAIAEYALGKVRDGLNRLIKLQNHLPNDNVHKDMHALVSLNLARMAFQDKQYKEAIKYFKSIDKSHPLWLPALTEASWAQLMDSDNEGAIGNMHSIQSPYFKAVYKPESYIVRTIGYLNICQYADAYRTLSFLEKEYRPWYSGMLDFKKKNKTNLDYYKTMVTYLKSPSQTNVGGLPYQVLREMGRHRDFLNLQEAINARFDEKEQYKFIKNYVTRDIQKAQSIRNSAKQRLASIEQQIKRAEKDAKYAKDLNQLRLSRNVEKTAIDFQSFQLEVFAESSKGYRKLEKSALAKLERTRSNLSLQAGKVLKNRMENMMRNLVSYFENNEFLRYEVFAGSGENIRYHMGGGEVKADARRIPSSAKPQNKKLNWDFDGEFWEDEIGNYKSSLKNNCGSNQAAN